MLGKPISSRGTGQYAHAKEGSSVVRELVSGLPQASPVGERAGCEEISYGIEMLFNIF